MTKTNLLMLFIEMNAVCFWKLCRIYSSNCTSNV